MWQNHKRTSEWFGMIKNKCKNIKPSKRQEATSNTAACINCTFTLYRRTTYLSRNSWPSTQPAISSRQLMSAQVYQLSSQHTTVRDRLWHMDSLRSRQTEFVNHQFATNAVNKMLKYAFHYSSNKLPGNAWGHERLRCHQKHDALCSYLIKLAVSSNKASQTIRVIENIIACNFKTIDERQLLLMETQLLSTVHRPGHRMCCNQHQQDSVRNVYNTVTWVWR